MNPRHESGSDRLSHLRLSAHEADFAARASARRAALLGVALSFLQPVLAQPMRPLRIGGSGSAVGSMALVAAAFNRQMPAAPAVEVLPAIGSRGALRAVVDGRLDIALTNLMPAAEVSARLHAMEYARTPYVIAVRAGAALKAVSAAELAALYAADSRFPDGTRARPVMRPGDDIDNQVIASFSPAVALALKAALARPGMLSAATDSDAADLIASVPGAFGGCTLAQILSERRPLQGLIIDGQAPSVEGLRLDRYRQYKTMVMVSAKEPTPAVKQFVDFVTGPVGRSLLAENGHLTA